MPNDTFSIYPCKILVGWQMLTTKLICRVTVLLSPSKLERLNIGAVGSEKKVLMWWKQSKK